jgi:hypothetical protein
MSFREIQKGYTDGETGAIIDEEVLQNHRGVFISYACYDETGELIYYFPFERNVSPEEIAMTLNRHADDYLEFPPEDMTPKEIKEMARTLKKLAKSVPGLRSSAL